MRLQLILDFISPIKCDAFDSNINVMVKSIEDVDFNRDSLGWCSDKNLDYLFNIKKGYVILSKVGELFCEKNAISGFSKIVVEHPRKTFASILNKFFVKENTLFYISPSSIISESVVYNKEQITIGHNVVLEDDVILGDKVIIGSNSVIKSGTIIKNNVKIGSNCTIGGVGFGYEPNEEGIFELIPHIGNVVLEENVEIGNNVCIDRAVLGSTRLSKNVKIDNLDHIAHGVQIGENSLIIAHAMIAGSVKIGKNVWVAPNVSIKQKLSIGDNSVLGLGSVVIKDVANNDVVAGIPAKSIKK